VGGLRRGAAELAAWLWDGDGDEAGDPAALRRALGAALAPAELAFRAAARAYHGAYDAGLLRGTDPGLPALSVGNLVVGGAGKTPVARWVVAELLARGARPALLHGGYGADEPELHRRWHPAVPVLVGRDRAVSAAQARARGATVLVLDDGFQHRRLERRVDLVLVPAESWSRQPRLFPRGRWREPPRALARAGVVAVTRRLAGPEAAALVAGEAARFTAAPVAVLALVPTGWAGSAAGRDVGAARPQPPPTGPVLAVTAIARPRFFAAAVERAGAGPVELATYPDHHAFTAADAAEIVQRARGRQVVLTAKDAVKLDALLPAGSYRVLDEEVRVERGADMLAAALDGLVT
jgi:tetraacyldisaccharide 4'-kinase